MIRSAVVPVAGPRTSCCPRPVRSPRKCCPSPASLLSNTSSMSSLPMESSRFCSSPAVIKRRCRNHFDLALTSLPLPQVFHTRQGSPRAWVTPSSPASISPEIRPLRRRPRDSILASHAAVQSRFAHDRKCSNMERRRLASLGGRGSSSLETGQ